jgi:hypothetical protein
MLAPGTKRVSARLPDEALYALALYIYSLLDDEETAVLAGQVERDSAEEERARRPQEQATF